MDLGQIMNLMRSGILQVLILVAPVFPGDHFDSGTDAHVFAENAHDFGGARAFGRLDVRDVARLYDRAFWANSRARAIARSAEAVFDGVVLAGSAF